MNRLPRLSSLVLSVPLAVLAAAGAAPLVACGSAPGAGEPSAEASRASEATVEVSAEVLHCKPGQKACSGVCVYVESDPLNCGACGHSCEGGACSAGVCQPLTLASSVYYPTAMTVHGAYAYWADDNGYVRRVGINGGTAANVVAASGVQAMIANANTLFFTEGNTVASTPLAGGIVATVATGSSPYGLALSGTNLYWTNYSDGTVWTTLLTGGSPSEVASGQSGPYKIALYKNTLFWTNYSGDSVEKLSGSTLHTLSSSEGSPFDIHADATDVYWADYSTYGSIVKVPHAGGTPVTLATGLYYPRMTADTTAIYFSTNESSGGIFKIPLSGGNVTTLATGQYYPYDVHVDATSVYWINQYSTGAVMKVAKN